VTETKVETIVINKKQENKQIDFEKLMFANLAKLIRRDLNDNKQANSTFNRKFKKTDVMDWLENPLRYEKKLRDLSRFLLHSSSHYKRIIDYFATIPTFDYVVNMYNQTDYSIKNKDIVLKKYIETINLLEIMNIKHEFLRLLSRAWVDDVVYGYEYSTKNSYFIDILDPDYCAISSIEDGALNYSFNFQYFDKNPEQLERFSDEFQQKYKLYKQSSKKYKWQELDSKKTICIKISDTDYSIPPLAGIFEEIYSLYDYKDLQLSKTELENYLLLIAKMPYQKDTSKENAFALSLDKAIEFYELMQNNLHPGIGSVLSPFDSIEPVNLKKKEGDLDTVTLAENSLYNAAGIPKTIFNSDKATGAALTKAIINDEAMVFKIVRQFERWLNRKLKDEIKKVNFKVTFLDITKYNRDEVINSYKEATTLGVPCKLLYCASLGMTPSDVMNSLILENDVLNITDNFIPLQSSHTMSSRDGGGRPKKSEGELQPSSEGTIERDDNNPDNRK